MIYGLTSSGYEWANSPVVLGIERRERTFDRNIRRIGQVLSNEGPLHIHDLQAQVGATNKGFAKAISFLQRRGHVAEVKS